MFQRLLIAALAASLLASGAEAASRKGQDGGQSAAQGKQSEEQVQPGKEKQFPTGAQWTLVSLGGRQATGTSRPSMQLDAQYRIKGFAGCNTFSATAYPQARQGFAVSAIAQTKKACDPATMTFEREFLLALRTATFWDLAGGYLVIRGQHGELKFDRAL